MPGFSVFGDIIAGGEEDTNMKTHRGFTLIEALIVMAVIAILAALGTLGVDEYVTSAKATKIIMNLHTMKKALWEWYVDNRDKVQADGKVKLGTGNPRPIQELQINNDSLNLSKYLKRLGASKIKFKSTVPETITMEGTGEKTTRGKTDLYEGYYGVCDDGTTVTVNNNNFEKAENRNIWYVGYRFTSDEGAVREKIRGRMKTAGGLRLGTADAHPIPEGSDKLEEAVWLKVR